LCSNQARASAAFDRDALQNLRGGIRATTRVIDDRSLRLPPPKAFVTGNAASRQKLHPAGSKL
jgi:hypothetical protein